MSPRVATRLDPIPLGLTGALGTRQETVVVSTLRNINPTIEILQRLK